MRHANFAHLRAHSAYSLSEGALTIKELVKLCQENEMPAVAITDTGNLFGALEFAMAAAAGGVQPIVGVQLAIARETVGALPAAAATASDQLVLLAQNEDGYQNLLNLVSKPYLDGLEGDQAILRVGDLAEWTAGLLALTGGPAGGVARLLAEGQGPAAEHLVAKLAELFPDRLYVEIQRHGLPIEDKTEPGLLDIAYRHNLPIVATNEAFFADRSMRWGIR